MRRFYALSVICALATGVGTAGCGRGSGNDDTDPITFLSIGYPEIFNHTCSTVHGCPALPDVGSSPPVDGTISIANERWANTSPQQIQIEVKAIDNVAVARIRVWMISDAPIQFVDTGGGTVEESGPFTIVTFNIPEEERAVQSIVNLQVLFNEPEVLFRAFATSTDAASLDDVPSLGVPTETIFVILEE